VKAAIATFRSPL